MCWNAHSKGNTGKGVKDGWGWRSQCAFKAKEGTQLFKQLSWLPGFRAEGDFSTYIRRHKPLLFHLIPWRPSLSWTCVIGVAFSWIEDELSADRKPKKVQLQMKIMTGNPWQSSTSSGSLSSYVIVFQFSKLSFFHSFALSIPSLTVSSLSVILSSSYRRWSESRQHQIPAENWGHSFKSFKLPSIQDLKGLE